MKKKITLSIYLLCTLLIFSACSKESRGVPESVILQTNECQTFSNSFSNMKHKIHHDVDTSAHTDRVIATLTAETSYATITQEFMYFYQYQKENDIWTLTDTQKTATYTTINQESIISNSPWTQKMQGLKGSKPVEYTYNINVHNMDITNNQITISYMIDFTDMQYSDIDQSTPITLTMNEAASDYSYYFNIDFSSSGWFKDVDFFISPAGLTGWCDTLVYPAV